MHAFISKDISVGATANVSRSGTVTGHIACKD